MSTWTCTTCNITIKSSSKYRHVKTQKHKNKLNPKQTEDCNICCNIATSTRSCRSCKQEWCSSCDRDIARCPYCRADIPGRQVQARVQARENYNWYASSDAFRPTQQSDIDRFRVVRHNFDLLLHFMRHIVEA